LFYFLAWRDLLVRYKQTVVGLAWSLIRPILTKVLELDLQGLLPAPGDFGGQRDHQLCRFSDFPASWYFDKTERSFADVT
jgi:hypothetical protein